jgi:predicted O-linked N-acetylglucosamine transferase (SPINDLY family)
MNLQSLFQQAAGLHQRGQLAEAERLYMELLQVDPFNAGGQHLLGVLRSQQGRNEEAITLIAGALKSNPKDFGAFLNYGLVLQRCGRMDEALKSYDRALTIRQDFVEAHFNRAVLLTDLGRREEALAAYDRALRLRPNHVDAFYNRGTLLSEMGRYEEAVASFDRALAFNPRMIGALDNRGNALRAMGRHAEALASYDRALGIEPRLPGALYNRAVTLADMKRHDEAMRGFDAALAANPDFAPAHFSRGGALAALGRFEEALAAYDRALALNPSHGEAANDRGVALWNLGRIADALAAFEQAVKIAPALADAHVNRAGLLYAQHHYPDALAAYERALDVAPEHANAWNGRGSTLRALKRFEEALACFDRAIALDPGHIDAYSNRAIVNWEDLGRYQPALADREKVLTLDPDRPYARGELLHLKMHVCDWNGYEEQRALIDEATRAGGRGMQPFGYQAVARSPDDLQRCSTRFASDIYPAVRYLLPAPDRGHDKIRLGYVSGEFRDQATAQLMAGLYEQHDRDRFEIVAFDSGWHNDGPMRRRLESAFGKFVDIAQLSDEEAAQAVLREEIDILINLNGYFGDQRMGVFAHRPAPVQVNYLGFPATLGADYIDYILADRIVIPENEAQFYSEKVIWLPDSYQVNDSKKAIAEKVPTRASAGLPDNGFVFCNFNQSYKLTPDTFSAWMRILDQVPGSVLWLWQSRGDAVENLRREAAARGVAPERLIFAPGMPVAQHLARLRLADLFLDSLPYNAHTTGSDALWAGLPLLTCRGTAFPGRVAASLLQAAGLPELITESTPEFESRAIALAKDVAQLKAIRHKLAQNRLTCPLFNTSLFRRNIEKAYTAMWDMALRGEAPRSFSV